MQNLLEQVEQAVRERKLLRRGGRMLVAVSGGLDSMVLLHVLHELAAPNAWKLSVAHFNHQLRGRSSDADERLVRQVAKASSLHFEAGRGDVKLVAKQRGVSIEMAARDLRHKFLAETARRLKCPVIAVAHHADDQVELFFLRLLRGAGGDGLGGMKWSSVSSASKKVRLVRPFLDVTKEELKQFAHARKIQFREDASNGSRDILRNRVRHDLLPLLRKNFQPALDRTVLRLMDLIGADAEAVNLMALDWMAQPQTAARWAKAPTAVQRRMLQLQLQQLRVPVDFDLVESLRLQPGKAVSINLQQSVSCDSSGRMTVAVPYVRDFKRGQRELNLTQQTGPVTFAGLELEWRFVNGAGLFRRGKRLSGECFDADKVGSAIVLRHWRPGDRFQPIGMSSSVKLQDWFTNQKIPATRRRELVLATTVNGEIFWVEGLRIGEKFKLDNDTRNQLRWCWQRT